MALKTAFRCLAICGMAALWSCPSGCGVAPPSDPVESFTAPNGQELPGAEPAAETPGSVGEVASGEFPGELSGDDGASPAEGPQVQIRNLSPLAARVTIVFSLSGLQAHVAYLRVLGGTMETVISPVSADRADISGMLADGSSLLPGTFSMGKSDSPTAGPVYVIDADSGQPGGSEGEPPPEGADEPPGLILESPAGDVALALGSTLDVRWSDESGAGEAIVIFYLRPVGDPDRSRWIQLSPALSAALDGINDELMVVLQGAPAGQFELVGEISTFEHSVLAVGPGKLFLFHDPGNLAPVINIVTPTSTMQLGEADFLDIEWEDSDADSSAQVFLSLFGVLDSGETVTFPLAGPIAEDPDGPQSDSMRVSMRGILPGTYDLVASLTDGLLSGVSRREHAVQITSTGHNVAPAISIREPAEDVEVSAGGSFAIAWTDEDADSSAIISLMLDPDLGAESLDGNEILLISSIAEDPDGATSDEVRLGLPQDVHSGKYVLAASITDGLSQAVAFAPGLVLVLDRGEGQGGEPSLDAVWPIADQHLRLGGSFSFGVTLKNVSDEELQGRYQLRADLTNGEYSVDLLPISVMQVNGGSRAWSVDGSRLHIPNEARVRRFEVVFSLLEGEQLVARDVAEAPFWFRRELRFDSLEVVNVDCSRAHGTDNARLYVGWTGGGWDEWATGTSILVRFFLAKDGIWPPPLPDDRTHRLIHAELESFGESGLLDIPWSDIGGMDEGSYIVVAVLDDPYVGEIVRAFTDRPFEICHIDGQGGGQAP
ncbi:MAG: hypothetical protein IT449_00585 [Phycisphaerales bacterium]|nr:hypothetical protein [Phycisphaerales bacterium]